MQKTRMEARASTLPQPPRPPNQPSAVNPSPPAQGSCPPAREAPTIIRQAPSMFVRVTRIAQLGEGSSLPPRTARPLCEAMLRAIGFDQAATATARSIRAMRSGDIELTFSTLEAATTFLRGKDRFLRGTPVWANYWTPSQRPDPEAIRAVVAAATSQPPAPGGSKKRRRRAPLLARNPEELAAFEAELCATLEALGAVPDAAPGPTTRKSRK